MCQNWMGEIGMVIQMLKVTAPALAAIVLSPACAAPPERDAEAASPIQGTEPEQRASPSQGNGEGRDASSFHGSDEGRQEVNVTDETAVSRRFETLDAYLAFLESRAPIDGHWYREIRPGVYRLETGNYRGAEIGQRIFTREELERKYGYSPR